MLDFLLGVAVVAAIYGILAISLNLQAGATGLLNFGLVGFFGIGAYATGISTMHGAPWPLGMAIGLVLAAAAGAAVGRLGRTLAAEYWAIATLALAELLRLVALNTDSLTRGPQGISAVPGFFSGLGPQSRDLAWLGLAALVLALCWWVSQRVTGAQFGRVLRLVREQPDLAASLGHDVVGAKVRVMAISAPMAALAGSLYTHYISFIGPGQLEPFATFLVWTMVVVGGLGNAFGVIAGAAIVQLLFDVTRFIDDVFDIPSENAGGLRILVVGAALLGFLYFRSGGLVPERLRRIDARS
ncbi:MAG: branched-chain amino acid ABC transporter permease [Thermoleophilaceae bacterium]|nr:branched-chain amino acid ABC transporter permease [Thermoleophilaceae bacterium]